MAGLTPEGFEAKTFEASLADVEARQRAAPALGADIDLSIEGPLGQINGILCAHHREVWEVAAAVYAARDRDGATGQALTQVASLTGSDRRGVRAGQVTLAVSLAAGVTLPAGSVADVGGDGGSIPAQPTNRWVTAVDVTNLATTTATLGVLATQENPGPLPAAGATINHIATPVAGWLSVTNLAAAVPGADAEGDPALRQRAEAELQGAASSPVDAIAAALSRVPLVTDVIVTENASDAVDAEGRPKKSVEALVVGGDPEAIALALWRAKAGGIQTWGVATSGHTPATHVVGDVRGLPRVVRFSRPVDIAMYVVVALRISARRPPTAAAVKAAVLAVGNALRPADHVVRAVMSCAVLDLGGVTDVLALAIGTSLELARQENFEVGPRQRARFDASRIEVSLVP